MNCHKLTARDQELIDAAAAAIRSNFLKDHHHVGAAVRARSGRIYVGVHLESPGHDVCAEPVALGAAATAGERDFECIVAVRLSGAGKASARRGSRASRPHVLSPCGICREMLYYYAPRMHVIVPANGDLCKVAIADLLPIPWTSTKIASK